MDHFKKLCVFITAIISVFITGCGVPPAANTANTAETKNGPIIGKPGGSVVYRVTSPIKTMNYYMADDEPSVLLTLFLLNDRLVALDHEKQQYVPSLAESYSTGPDGKTVNVLLKEGVKFSDGKPITSADVEFSLKGAYDKRTNSPIFRDGLLVNGKEIETAIEDERRFKLIFPEKVASVENYLENLAILPKHILEGFANEGKLSEAWKITEDPRSVVTSGSFIVDSVQTGERVILKKNPNYWKRDAAGNQLPYLDSLVLEIVGDANNTAARLQQGTIDIADRIRTTDFAGFRTSNLPVKPLDAGPGLTTDHIWFNLNPAKKNGEKLEETPKHKWFSDKRFRRAVAYAIDRASIATNTLQGLATPLFGFVPAGDRAWLNPDLPKIDYDVEKAKSLLLEAGFLQKDNNGKPELFDAAGNRVEFTMIVPAENEPRKLMAAVVQEDLAKLGINVQIAPVDFQGLTERWTTSFDYDAVLLGTSVSALDPSSFAGFVMSSAGVHQWRPKQEKPATDWEAKADELFTRQSQETDPAARKKIFNEIQVIFSEEMPVVPIVSRHIISAANERIGNLSPSSILPFAMWNADRIYVK